MSNIFRFSNSPISSGKVVSSLSLRYNRSKFTSCPISFGSVDSLFLLKSRIRTSLGFLNATERF
ncbi:hypothetical protein LEP1GSC083_0130 [Leptospira interrogans serovar Pyrogenes str. L0374]|uniref:Uncharacterized protein n=1 Tax=Leptospira interrogans serovar Pyrogenes str. L0374 TaxID=1049928 RepID=M6K1W5_LEPIR|nr:hypothetical protein LEP1GSC083_0130 [Leptospira interrogans serovar Pyrogenes str. L0374]